jgi:hypothetical protein
MSECRSTSCGTTSFPKKYTCPVNGKDYGQVSATTIKHHIKAPWAWVANSQGYYFCSDPNCEVVYFGQDNSVVEKTEVRAEVGVKEKSRNALICYCYGVTKEDAETNPHIRNFVIEETEQQQCACEAKNPSGKCCLVDFLKK